MSGQLRSGTSNPQINELIKIVIGIVIIVFGLVLVGYGIKESPLKKTFRTAMNPSVKVELLADEEPEEEAKKDNRRKYDIMLPKDEDWQDTGIWLAPGNFVAIKTYKDSDIQPFEMKIAEAEFPSKLHNNNFFYTMALVVPHNFAPAPFTALTTKETKLYLRINQEAVVDFLNLKVIVKTDAETNINNLKDVKIEKL